MERRGNRTNGERLEATERTGWNGEELDRKNRKRNQMERREIRWNGERPEGTEWDQMERKGVRRNGEGLDGMERSHLSRTERNHL